MFAHRDLLGFYGLPEDVREIRSLLVSERGFGSAQAFNDHMREELARTLGFFMGTDKGRRLLLCRPVGAAPGCAVA
jgi:hypothetical protein